MPAYDASRSGGWNKLSPRDAVPDTFVDCHRCVRLLRGRALFGTRYPGHPPPAGDAVPYRRDLHRRRHFRYSLPRSDPDRGGRCAAQFPAPTEAAGSPTPTVPAGRGQEALRPRRGSNAGRLLRRFRKDLGGYPLDRQRDPVPREIPVGSVLHAPGTGSGGTSGPGTFLPVTSKSRQTRKSRERERRAISRFVPPPIGKSAHALYEIIEVGRP